MMKDISIIGNNPNISGISADANFGVGVRTGSIAGKFLVATPALQDSGFDKAVIYMCQHGKNGAMGIIVNRLLQNIKLDDIMEQLNVKGDYARNLSVHFGGPVEANRGFIIHSDEFLAAGTFAKSDGLAVTSNADVLKAMANGTGPRRSMLALGYSGWSAGQLEAEMESGSWIVTEASPQLLFDTDNELKWSLSIASLGFDMGNFSTVVGHA